MQYRIISTYHKLDALLSIVHLNDKRILLIIMYLFSSPR
jgi:hypothetical protein